MDWVHQFYQRQNELLGVYTGDIEDHHRQKAELIKQQHPTATNILELGAGGGQVACASALAGYDVTAIELVSSLANHAQTLANQHHINNLTLINDDFYTVTIHDKFDVITYWDGFGVGTDDEQIQLFRRCASWLKSGGLILMDISTPWYWAQASGQMMTFGKTKRRYGFDANDCRLLDTWWHIESPEDKVTQSIRCYSPADLRLLLKEANLELIGIAETGGAIDRSTGNFSANVELHRAMSYVAKIGINSDTTHPHNTV
jgi:cyclopropane fatty-acyl-phospholipid synthase-like methyltransferase